MGTLISSTFLTVLQCQLDFNGHGEQVTSSHACLALPLAVISERDWTMGQRHISVCCSFVSDFMVCSVKIHSALRAVKFWVFWTLQAVWVWVTLLPVMILNGCANNPSAHLASHMLSKHMGCSRLSSCEDRPVYSIVSAPDAPDAHRISPYYRQHSQSCLKDYAASAGIWPSDVIGVILWVAGFAMESAADFQKYGFKQNPANKGRFVNVGKPGTPCMTARHKIGEIVTAVRVVLASDGP